MFCLSIHCVVICICHIYCCNSCYRDSLLNSCSNCFCNSCRNSRSSCCNCCCCCSYNCSSYSSNCCCIYYLIPHDVSTQSIWGQRWPQLVLNVTELIINHIKLSYVDNVCMKMLKVTKFQNFIFNHCRKNTPKSLFWGQRWPHGNSRVKDAFFPPGLYLAPVSRNTSDCCYITRIMAIYKYITYTYHYAYLLTWLIWQSSAEILDLW